MSNIWQAHGARLIPGDTILIGNVDASAPTVPTPLPSLPLSLCSHTRELFRRCYERNGRCVAAILLYDVRDHRWLPPRIPRQICGIRRPSALNPSFLDNLPAHVRVLGCLQSAAKTTSPTSLAQILPMDGIFAVFSPDPDEALEHWFIRIENRLIPVRQDEVAVDDWRQTLTLYQSNLRID